MGKAKLPYEIAKKKFKAFPTITPQRKAYQAHVESIPLERAERRALSLDSLCRTADRLLIYDTPANKNARSSVQPWKQKHKKPKRSVLVYLVRFTSIISDEPSFLKIGITNDPKGRFQFDSYRYNLEYLRKSPLLRRTEALAIEVGLHRMFESKSYVPKLKLLSRGNTECFIDDAEIVETVTKAFQIIESELAGIAQSVER